MGYSWADFKTAVIPFLTDRTPTDANFAAAVTEYVRARMQRDIIGDKDLYAITQNRYTAMRRALAGYLTAADSATLKAAVLAQLSEGSRTNAQVVQAVAYYVRAELAREVDARGEVATTTSGGQAMGISSSCRADYQRLRLRLCGFAHTLAGGLGAAVANLLPVDSQRLNSTTYIATLEATAVEDIQSLGAWIDAQIAAAKDDLQALSDRVQKEIRAGVIDLTQKIRAYQVGNEDTFIEADIETRGNAALGSLADIYPDGAQLREAWIMYPAETCGTAACNQRPCQLVPWNDRTEKMICANVCAPQIAISPKGDDFVVTPALVDGKIALRVVVDGTKLLFDDGDVTALDEEAARAVGKYVNAELATEWGDPLAQQQILRAAYLSERTRLYLKHKDRAAIRP